MNPRITTVGTPEQAPSPIDRFRIELTEIDNKIKDVTAELLIIPKYYSPNAPPLIQSGAAANRLCEKYPEALSIGGRDGTKLTSPTLKLAVKSELDYLYNRKLQLQKLLDKAML